MQWKRFSKGQTVAESKENVESLQVAKWIRELRKSGWVPSAELEARRQEALRKHAEWKQQRDSK